MNVTSQPAHDPLCRSGELIASSYLIVDLLGVGGMGVVYAAVQRSLDRVVAVKLPRPELVDDEEVRARLRSEAFAGATLSHPNVVHVLDFGTDQGVPFVVMEYVKGPRLSQLLVELGPLPVATALGLVRQIVAGLEEAHANGIVHADVKCDNVLVETLRDGSLVPRLIDFGIARFTAQTPPPVRGDPMISGTAEYLSPEVIRGELPTCAADVYAIGVMLYELVTGTPPFTGASSAEVMSRCLQDEVIPLTLRCPDRVIPPAFDALVMRALARDAHARFPDAHALARAIATIEKCLPQHGPTREHVKTMPPPFASEEPTPSLNSVVPIARASTVRADPPAAGDDDDDVLVVSCLERARSFVDTHCLAAAISELETGIVQLSTLRRATPVWRLQLTLAALYDGVGDRSRARIVVRDAKDAARLAGSAAGYERAERLAMRLGRRRTSNRRRAW